jgi:all-trans-retinol 13,14-reductase
MMIGWCMNRTLFFLISFCCAIGILVTVSWSKEDLDKMSSWDIKIDTSRPKAENEYDVIIAGGGFGGLSCGALLAKNGYKVLVLEKNPSVGGLCSSYEVNGYRFCYGAEDIEGLGETGSVAYLLSQVGFERSSYFVPNSHTFFDGHHPLTVDVEKDSFENTLMQAYPKAAAEIRSFFAKARLVYEEGYDNEMIKKWGIIVPQGLRPKAMPEEWMKNYPETHKNLIEWNNKQYQEVLDEYFSDTELKVVLCGFVPYLGVFPYNTPASTIVLHTFGYFFSGGYQALKTPQHFAEALAAYIKNNWGDVLCNRLVDKILIHKKTIKGAAVGKDEFLAPIVVCNINAKTAYVDLIDHAAIPADFLKEMSALPLGNSVLSLHLAVDHPLSAYSSVIQDRYNHVYLAIPTRNDPSLAPKGKSIVVLREAVRFTDFIRNGTEEEDQYLKKRVGNLLAKGQELVPELAKDAVIQKIVTPSVYAQLDNIPYGSVYGFDVSTPVQRPYFRSPIPGLYLSSSSVGRAGVDSVIFTGILCTHDIMGWQK